MEGPTDTRNEYSDSRDQTASKTSPQSDVTRRGFLKRASTGAVGTAVASRSTFFSPALASAQGSWRHEADIVVVGAGAAGPSAALNAHRLGNSVLLLEKAATFGGTAAKSAGRYWIPNNALMQAEGIQDSREDAMRYMVRVAYPYFFNPTDAHLGIPPEDYEVLGAFYDNAAPALEALHSMTTIRSGFKLFRDGKPALDYRADLPENKGIRGRSIGPKTASGADETGAHLVEHMRQAVVQRGIPLLYGHRASRLLLNKRGEVVGVQAKTPNGEISAIRAFKGVIFCTGGFTNNRELRLNFLRGPVYGGCAVPTNEGDFVYIAAATGASLVNMTNAWWNNVLLEQAVESSSTPADLGYPPGESIILVNRYGRRIVSEKMNYHDRTQIHFVFDPARHEYPNLFTFMIYDQRTADRSAGTFPIPPRGTSRSYILSGRTLEELVPAIEARLDKLAAHTGNFRLDGGFGKQLKQTIARFNDFAKRGVDEDFHRGETLFEQLNSPPAPNKDNTNRGMHPISPEGPYYAVILAAGTLDTHGGPKINARAQVIATSGRPIPGLYGAGNCIGIAGQAYWGAGGTIAPAITFGYIAAREASKEAIKEVEGELSR